MNGNCFFAVYHFSLPKFSWECSYFRLAGETCIFDMSNLFSFLISNSGPTLSVSQSFLVLKGWVGSPPPRPPRGFEQYSSIITIYWNRLFDVVSICISHSLQEPRSHPNFTPSPSAQGPKIFEGRTHVLFIHGSPSCSTGTQEMLKNLWWLDQQMERWQEGQGMHFSDS